MARANERARQILAGHEVTAVSREAEEAIADVLAHRAKPAQWLPV
ncbi:MAG: hypothetical protein ACP5JJ_03395 [Anaerolineae bacterium]